jgi:hypothetical protein
MQSFIKFIQPGFAQTIGSVQQPFAQFWVHFLHGLGASKHVGCVLSQLMILKADLHQTESMINLISGHTGSGRTLTRKLNKENRCD